MPYSHAVKVRKEHLFLKVQVVRYLHFEFLLIDVDNSSSSFDHLAQDRDQWLALVNMIMNFLVL
jgi:L-ribulose-5-phosphate 3-epimerase UlaE